MEVNGGDTLRPIHTAPLDSDKHQITIRHFSDIPRSEKSAD